MRASALVVSCTPAAAVYVVTQAPLATSAAVDALDYCEAAVTELAPFLTEVLEGVPREPVCMLFRPDTVDLQCQSMQAMTKFSANSKLRLETRLKQRDST